MPTMTELNASLPQRPVPATAQLNPFIQQPPVPATAQLNPFLQHPSVLAMAEPYPIFQHPPMPLMPEPHPFLQHPQVPTMPESHPFLQHLPVPAMPEPHPCLQQPLTSAMAESDFDFNESGLPNYHVDNGACAPGSLNPLRINYEYMEPDLQPVVPPGSTMPSNSDNTMNLDSMVFMASNDLLISDIDASVFDSRSTINMVNRECTGFIRNSLDLPRELCHLSSSVLNNNMAESGDLANNDDDGFESLFEALEELLDEGEGPIPTPSTP